MQKRTDGWALVLYGLIIAMALGVLGSIVFFVAGIYHDSYDINIKMYQQNWHVTIPATSKKNITSPRWVGSARERLTRFMAGRMDTRRRTPLFWRECPP